MLNTTATKLSTIKVDNSFIASDKYHVYMPLNTIHLKQIDEKINC